MLPAFGQLLPESLLNAPRLGAINVHASLLPKYRGGAPIHQAIIDGEEKTGITIMYMVKKLDAGNIISQKAINIEEDDNVGTMHDKLSFLGAIYSKIHFLLLLMKRMTASLKMTQKRHLLLTLVEKMNELIGIKALKIFIITYVAYLHGQ